MASRGFSSVQSNKLLVLNDTRSIYTPLFSGVAWDSHDLMLEDVERVEVIRGPGAALWGANAVNGVINVITRSAASTQGTYATLGAGTGEQQAQAREYRQQDRVEPGPRRAFSDGGIECLDSLERQPGIERPSLRLDRGAER